MTDTPEIRPYPPCPDYGASADGRVWRITQPVSGTDKRAPYELARCNGPQSYLIVRFAESGKMRTMRVNRVVCECFHGTPPKGAHAAHGDGDKRNDAAWNLRWATPAENYADRARHGHDRCGDTHPAVKIPDAHVVRIQQRRAAGASENELAAEYGVSRRTINNVVRGVRKVAA